MLSPRPWKANAITRLILSVLVCIYVGFLLVLVVHHPGVEGDEKRRLFWLVASALTCLMIALALLRQPWRFADFRRTEEDAEAQFWTTARIAAFLIFFYGAIVLATFAQKLAGPSSPS